jgi:hypothetical protein
MIKEIPNESKFCVSYGQLKDATGPYQQHLLKEQLKKETKITLCVHHFLLLSISHHKRSLKFVENM